MNSIEKGQTSLNKTISQSKYEKILGDFFKKSLANITIIAT
jgi:hypothetical protein